jgi:hypothetical protein
MPPAPTRSRTSKTLGPLKYLKDRTGEHLFDITNDPGEKADIRTRHADHFEVIRRQYQACISQMLPLPPSS